MCYRRYVTVPVDDNSHLGPIGETLDCPLLCRAARTQVAVCNADTHVIAGNYAVRWKGGLQVWRIHVPVHGDNRRYLAQQLQHRATTNVTGMQD
jgi:hypothetical protein